jgi:hypothetical protein
MPANQNFTHRIAIAKGYSMRPVEVGDYEKGYLQLLNQLTDAGTLTKDQFAGSLNSF